jgi:ATP phosphoribosyltransferase regulatory subunit
MSLQELNIRLKDYFIELGFQYVELPLVHDSDIFYETSGEEIRSQMYSFIDGSGKEKCLRPDMTIPTCQCFIKSDDKINEANLCYSGPVFRSTNGINDTSIELNQSGVEIIFTEKKLKTIYEKDIYTLKTAVKILEKLNINEYQIKIGSLNLFNSFISYLDLPIRWKQRIVRHFFRRTYFDSLLNRLGQGVGYDILKKDEIINEKLGLNANSSGNLTDLINSNSNSGSGSRTVEEIVKRFQEKSENIVSESNGKQIVNLIKNFLGLNASLDTFPNILREFVSDQKLDFFKKEIDGIEEFKNAVSSEMDISKINFNNDFGHSIEFYDGVMFEIYDQSGNLKIITGGRYDKLLNILGSRNKLSAIGFATNNNNLSKIL